MVRPRATSIPGNFIHKIESLFSRFDFADSDKVKNAKTDFGLGLDLKELEKESGEFEDLDLVNVDLERLYAKISR